MPEGDARRLLYRKRSGPGRCVAASLRSGRPSGRHHALDLIDQLAQVEGL
jgi:hypothetical protein